MKKFHYVYIITNMINGKQYIGDHSTNNLNDTYLGGGIYIKHAVKQYKKENFKREILEQFETKQKAFDAQEKWIKFYKTHISEGGYNISLKGGHQCNGGVSDETKQKMKDNHYDCSGSNNGMFGKTHTEKAKQILKEKRKIQGNPMTGKHHTKNAKENMSAAQLGNKNHMFGKHLSIEHRNRIIESNKNRKRINKTT